MLKDAMIHNYQDMESLVNEGIWLALQVPNPDKTIDVILEYLGKALNGERTYIFEKGKMDVTITPMNEFIQRLPQDENLGVIYCDITGLKKVNWISTRLFQRQKN